MGGRSNPYIRWCLRALSSLCLALAVAVPFAVWYVHDLATAASVGQLASLPMTALGMVGTSATRNPSRGVDDARQRAERERRRPQHYAPPRWSPDLHDSVGGSVPPTRTRRLNRFAVAASVISCLVALGSFAVSRSDQSADAVGPHAGLTPSAAAPAAPRTTTDPVADAVLPTVSAARPGSTGPSGESTALLFDGEVTL